MKIPLLSDLTHQIAKDYGVYLEDQGHTLRCIYCHWQYSCYVTLRLLRSELRMVGGTAVWLSSACLTENGRLWVTFDGSASWPSTMCESLSGDFSSSMTKASWGRSPWTISQWADLWTRLCGWCRPSSTLTNTEKVREGLFVLFNIILFNAQAYIHGGIKFFFISICVYITNMFVVIQKCVETDGCYYVFFAVCPAGWKPGSDTVSIHETKHWYRLLIKSVLYFTHGWDLGPSVKSLS